MDEDGSAVTTTGGTYAKVVKNIVPFGPSFKGQKGIGHLQMNGCVSVILKRIHRFMRMHYMN